MVVGVKYLIDLLCRAVINSKLGSAVARDETRHRGNAKKHKSGNHSGRGSAPYFHVTHYVAVFDGAGPKA